MIKTTVRFFTSSRVFLHGACKKILIFGKKVQSIEIFGQARKEYDCTYSVEAAYVSGFVTKGNFFYSIPTYKLTEGMVQANAGHKVMLITLSKGYFCTNFYIQWSRDITSQSTTTQTTNKHHHYGDGAAHPSSGVDLMMPHQPRGGRPCICSFQGHCQRNLFDSLN
jgi:hypothetical protein